MHLRSSRLWLGGVLIGTLVGGGCHEPPEIVLVAPPGVELEEALPIPEGGGAQALGEQAVHAAADAVRPVVSEDLAPPTAPGETARTRLGVEYETLVPGDGPQAQPGQTVVVHYTGTLENGTQFDSSRDQGQPFIFQLGVGQVIRGWDQGVAGMHIGERRKLIVPPEMGYGATSPSPRIPPNSTLIFDVELLNAR